MMVCAEIDEIASFRVELTPVQQPFRPEWHIQDGRQLLSQNAVLPLWILQKNYKNFQKKRIKIAEKNIKKYKFASTYHDL